MLKILFILLSFTLGANAIVSIAPVVIGNKPGISTKAQALFQTKRGNTDSQEYGAGLKVSYDNNVTYVLWSEINADYAKVSGKTNTNKTFAHIRYIHKLTPKEINWELFLQSLTNQFTDIKERILEGGGFRLHIKNHKDGDLFFGIGAFYEHIIYTDTINPTENNIRLNSYISYVKNISKTSKFSYIAYYEPNISNFSDYLISNAAELKVEIYKHLSLSLKLFYDLDSKPAIDVEKYDFTQNTSLIYEF